VLQSTSAAVQRATPTASCWQAVGLALTLPMQQSVAALQLLVACRQIAPAAWQPIALLHRPTRSPGFSFEHFAPAVAPQQSASFRHASPAGRQPVTATQAE